MTDEMIQHDLKDVTFSDIFELEEIQRLQDLFSNATGVASIITFPDGVPITQPTNFCRLCNDIIRQSEKGRSNCFRSDAILGRQNTEGPTVRTCLSGDIWDAGVSITVGGKHIANWLIGQVRNEKSNFQHMLEYAREIGVDPDVYLEALNEIPVMSFERFSTVADMLFQFVNEMSEKTYKSYLLNKHEEEREKYTALLRENEEKYRMLVENCHDIIFTVDLEGRFTYISPVWFNTMGYTQDDLLGVPFFTLLHPDDLEKCTDLYHQIRIDKTPIQNQEYKVLNKNGAILWQSTSLMPLLNEQGEIYSIYGTARDITNQKQAELEITRKNQELEKANSVKDKFFSIVAHDLRSPFGSLLGLSKMMAEDMSDFTMDQIQHIAESIHDTAENLYRLLENMLQWSKIQQDLVAFTLEPVVLAQVVDESLNLFKDAIRNKNITIETNIPASMLVYSDVNILQIVLRNLISNAQKFTPRGGKIEISAQKSEHNLVEIQVKDSGIGMGPDLLANIFRPDISTGRRGTENEPTTGLGLLLCKEFVEKQGGQVYAESKTGKGSVFHFTVQALPEKPGSL